VSTPRHQRKHEEPQSRCSAFASENTGPRMARIPDRKERHMTKTYEQKTCGMCGMEIPGMARKCPYCHVFQNRFSRATGHPLFGISIGLVAFVAITSVYGGLMQRMFDRGEDFQRYADQISVHDVRIEFGQLEGEPTVVVLGRLKNRSDIGWEDVKLLGEFYDADGDLVDVSHRGCLMYHVPAGGEVAFKISRGREFPESRYATARVKVLSAKDTRARW